MIDWIKENPALTTAVYGAMVSSIALGWNIYKYFQDKIKIKVDVKFGFVDVGGKISETLLIVSIVNKGKRSIYLSSIGFASGSWIINEIEKLEEIKKMSN